MCNRAEGESLPVRHREINWAKLAAIGDQEAFTALAHSLSDRLGRYSRMVCRQREDAEEIVQETLLQVYRKIGDLRDPEGVHAWIFRIALNQCRMRRRRVPSESESLRAPSQPAPSGPSPEELLLAGESGHQVEEAIRDLPESYREVLMLRCLEGLSTEETAEILDATPDAVRARLRRARQAIRHRLSGGQ